MNSKKLSLLVNQLAESSHKDQPTLITSHEKPLLVVLPVKNQQTFQAQQDKNLQHMKVEFNHVLAFVRSRLRHINSQQAQTKLAQLQQQIKQETDKS